MNGNRDFQLELRIDELVLHGLRHPDRAELGRVVEEELSRLFSQRGLPSSWSRDGSVGSLDGGTFTAQPGADVADVGGQIAHAIRRSFKS